MRTFGIKFWNEIFFFAKHFIAIQFRSRIRSALRFLDFNIN